MNNNTNNTNKSTKLDWKRLNRITQEYFSPYNHTVEPEDLEFVMRVMLDLVVFKTARDKNTNGTR